MVPQSSLLNQNIYLANGVFRMETKRSISMRYVCGLIEIKLLMTTVVKGNESGTLRHVSEFMFEKW